jgi:hypothetical protein
VSAKHKLNAAALNGAVLFAAVIGALAGSWPVFLGALGVLMVSAVVAKDIRP